MIEILAVGDSYTAGEGVAEGESWPRMLEGARSAGSRAVRMTVVARTGWTAAEARAGLAEARHAGPFAAATVQVGVNDQYRGGAPEAFERDLRLLLDDVTSLVGGEPRRLVVVSIPDWSVTPFAAGRDRQAVAAEIDAHNRVAASVAAGLGAALVDVTIASRAAGSDPALVSGDGLHPSPEMYRRWLPSIGDALDRALT